MRRYIRNKGGSIVFQRDVTQRFPSADGIFETVTKQPAIVLQFEPLLGGPYGHTPWDMPTAYEAFARIVRQVPSYANLKDIVDADGVVSTPMLTDPIMVPVHGFNSGAKRRGLVKNDGSVVGDEEQLDPMYGLWILDVDEFCKTNPHAHGREQEIEDFLDNPDLQRGDHYVKVVAQAPLPSPNYLELKGGGRGITLPVRVAEAVREGFLDANAVILYETYHPRDKSDEIIAAVKAAKQERDTATETPAVELVEA